MAAERFHHQMHNASVLSYFHGEVDWLTLLTAFIPEILIETRNRVTGNWFDLEVQDPPEPREVAGVSLVLFFDYPQDFRATLENYLCPVKSRIFVTACHHFTILNFGVTIQSTKVGSVLTQIMEEIHKRLQRENLRTVVERLLASAAIEPGLHILPTVSLVTFSTLETARLLFDLQVNLRDFVPQDPTFKADSPSVLWHSTYARILNQIPVDMLEMLNNRQFLTSDKKILLQDPYLGVSIFWDRKSMIQPEIYPIEIC